MTERYSVIDVHHHLIFPQMRAALRAQFESSEATMLFPEWSLQSDREAMERFNVTGALLSLPISGTPEQVHHINTALAEVSQQDSEHYGFLTSLPFSDPQAALQEIAYAVDTLKADGFVLPTNHQGIYLSDERLDPLLKELHRRSAVVLIHPSEPVQPAFPERPQAVYEFPFDTTRAVMELIYTGKLQRYPDIRWIVSQAGGTIPYLAYRLSIVSREAEMITQEPEEVIAALRSLYYDLALSTSPLVFQVLRELVGSSHILFGTDFPMRPERGVAQSIEQFFTYPGFPANEQHLIANQTARALFPRFR